MTKGPTDTAGEEKTSWKELARDLLVAAATVAILLVAIYAYAGVHPPLVIVESSSMQHGDRESFIGVIDTGDMVLQQAAPTRGSVVTYIEGRTTGYQTYGDYGDVIIFRRTSNPTPVIHRAILYIVIHENGTVDVPALANLPTAEWEGTDADGGVTSSPYYLTEVTIHGMGYNRDLDIRFDLEFFALPGRTDGYITMGDNNAYGPSLYDRGWLVAQEDIIGRARGEIPWIGLLKLTLQPTLLQIVGTFIIAVIVISLLRTDRSELLVIAGILAGILGFIVLRALFPSPPSGAECCTSWGDDEAPKNSWDSLLVSIVFLIALPFIYEYAARGWTKYVSPHMPKLRWPWRRGTAEDEPGTGRAPRGPDEGPADPPREGSSGP